DLARTAWPHAQVHALADSSPLVTTEPTRWTAMQAAWQMTFPPACASCTSDLGAMPAALLGYGRSGLLAHTRDQAISSYFCLTMDQLAAEITTMQSGLGTGQAAYLLGGTTHVLLGMPNAMTTTGVVLSTWVNEWATGDSAWANAGP